jgi:peptidoglycan hydrolase-like protein with peptidoglycan-binding domain
MVTSMNAAALPLPFTGRLAEDGEPRAFEPPPWHDVPLYAGRDLAREELWRLSQALAESKRRLARQRPCLPRARKASLSLVVAAVAAATPSLSLGHSRTAAKPGAAAAESGKNAMLELGDRGRAVARVQRALGILADGVFGPQTLSAVRAFQRDAGLEPDGIVGPLTKAALGLGAGGAVPGDGILEVGDRGPAVQGLQRALGIPADGIFGPQTRRAVRSFQRQAGLVVDGIVGPQTRAALASRAGAATTGAGHSHSDEGTTPAEPGIDGRLQSALRAGREMGLELISAHRPGATIASSGNVSDHSYNPSKAIDMAGTRAQMRRYARALAGRSGVQTIIYSGVGMWIHGAGWRTITSSVTYNDHLDHVHVDTF